MAGQPKQPTRNRKIEPLNWAEAANSPALKGMMSFLDIKPEEVRSGHFKDVPSDSDSHEVPVGDTLTGSESLKVTTGAKAPPANAVIEMRPKRSQSVTSLPQAHEVVPELEPEFASVSAPASDALPVSVSLTGSDMRPVSESPNSARVILGSVPSQNRKIRKCRLSQDAHSAGEETLYRILWEEGRPESANPLGSRVVRIGYAELANKARMHKANVRLNLANLTAKLAIEQSGDFSSRDMIAKSYRVLSYKEILERRRAAGLEYVIRQKNVVFVTAHGDPILLPGLTQKGKRRMGGNPLDTNGRYPVSDSLPVGESPSVRDSLPVSVSLPGSESVDYQADLACVSKAMNAYWTVDDAATDQLIRACRKVRPDAQAEEIAFFVSEKLELTRSNRAINNPVGLILATVPQSFSGYSFETFRQRRQERKRLAEEEGIRKAEEDRLLREWILRDAMKTLANPNSTEKSRREAEDLVAKDSEAQTDIQ
jgi:hypothetical protein